MAAQAYPTPHARHLAVAAAVLLLLGAVTWQASVVAWSAGVLLALFLARGTTGYSSRRIREAGFEMTWDETGNVKTSRCGHPVTLTVELRNYDTRAVRFDGLHLTASETLEVAAEQDSGVIPPSGLIRVRVKVTPHRVGRWAVHGLWLRVHGTPALFHVPLTFTNPFGIEVRPAGLGGRRPLPRGGRTRRPAESSDGGVQPGEGTILRELRDYLPGDAFRKIAWKASARRGHLIVREFERQERDLVWVVLDMSVEWLAGPVGDAPLDRAVTEAAVLCHQHLRRGDRVGLVMIGGSIRQVVKPAHGDRQAARISEALVEATNSSDAERSDLTEREVGLRVLEHIRGLDQTVPKHGPVSLDFLAKRAEKALRSAPFRHRKAHGMHARDQVLRTYLAAFGIDSPSRTEPESEATASHLARWLEQALSERPTANIVYVCAPPIMPPTSGLSKAVRTARRRGLQLRWVPTSLLPETTQVATPRELAASTAVWWKTHAQWNHAVRRLRRAGFHLIGSPIRPTRSDQGPPSIQSPGTMQTSTAGPSQEEAGNG